MPRNAPLRRHAITAPVFGRGKLHRKRLVEILEANLDKRLILVVAPAGYGKTMLLADLTAHIDRAVCWVRLTEHDRDPARLRTILVESLGSRFRKLTRRLGAHGLEALPADKIGRWLGRRIAEAEVPPFIVVFDDVHLVGASSESTALLGGLIDELPRRVCCVLAGREAPDLSLAGIVGAGDVLAIGAGDLALAEDELEDLLKLDGDAAAGAEVRERLMSESRGWIAGVQLLRLRGLEALQGSLPAPKDLTFEYFASEVLERQTEAMQRFALESSVLPVMTAEAVEAVCRVEDGARWLRQAVRKGLFITATGSASKSYEYHPLFREFLQASIGRVGGHTGRRLKLRAARFLAKEKGTEQAIGLYVGAGAERRALALAERESTELIYRGQLTTLEKWVSIADSQRSPSPKLRSSLIELLVVRGEIGRARFLIRMFIREFGRKVARIERLAFEAWDARLEAYGGDPRKAIEQARHVLRQIGDTNPHRAGRLAHAAIADGYIGLERGLPQAERHARAALRAARARGDALSQAYMELLVGSILHAEGKTTEERRVDERLLKHASVLKGHISVLKEELKGFWAHRDMRWSEALRYYDRAVSVAEESGSNYRTALEHYNAFEVCVDAGFDAEARRRYSKVSEVVRTVQGSWALIIANVGMARACRLMPDLPSSWNTNAVVRGRGIARSLELATERCALDLANGSRNVAPRLKSIIERVRRQHGPLYIELKAAYSLAHCAWRSGSYEEALTRASDAVHLAERIGYLHWIAGELTAASGFSGFLIEKLAKDRAVVRLFEGVMAARRGARRLPLPLHNHRYSVHINARMLGDDEILVQGKRSNLKPLYSEVLAYIIDCGRTSQEVLMETFWPGKPVEQQRSSAHSAIYSIRKFIGRSSIGRKGDLLLWSENIDLVSDVRGFESNARYFLDKGTVGTSLDTIAEILRVYQGPFLPRATSQWAVERRRELESLFVNLAYLFGQACLDQGRPAEAIGAVLAASRYDPFDERVTLLAGRLLARCGRRAHAILLLSGCRELFVREIGANPDPAIGDLERRLREEGTSEVFELTSSPPISTLDLTVETG